MANELGFFDVNKTGSTIYFNVFDATGRIRDVVAGAWDTYTDANVDNYDVQATEQGTSSGLFLADFPSGISAGIYYFVAKEQAGVSPAVSDDEVGHLTPIHWDGSAELPLSTILADLADGTVVVGSIQSNVIDASALAADAVDEIWDEVVESSYTARQLMRLIAAVLFGTTSGGGTTSITFTGVDGATSRIVATVDADGDRTAVTLDAT